MSQFNDSYEDAFEVDDCDSGFERWLFETEQAELMFDGLGNSHEPEVYGPTQLSWLGNAAEVAEYERWAEMQGWLDIKAA